MSDEIANVHIPTVAELNLDVTNIDVFCEQGVYDAKQSEKMLKAGLEKGWQINAHTEELVYIGGTEMACKLGARACSHLEKISDEAIRMMAEVWHLFIEFTSGYELGHKYR